MSKTYIPGPSDNVIHAASGRHIGTCSGSQDEKSFCEELNRLADALRVAVRGSHTPPASAVALRRARSLLLEAQQVLNRFRA